MALPDLTLEGTSSPTGANLLCKASASPITQILRSHDNAITFEPFSHSQNDQRDEKCLALIYVDEYRISLETRAEGFIVTSPEIRNVPRQASGLYKVTIPVSTTSHTYTTLLRPGDTIWFSQKGFHFNLKVKVEHVQVSSSMPREVAETQPQDEPSNSERRAHDDSPVRTSMTHPRTQIQVERSMQESYPSVPTATPLHALQSQVVEDTPETNRKAAFVPGMLPVVAKEALSEIGSLATNTSSESPVVTPLTESRKNILNDGIARSDHRNARVRDEVWPDLNEEEDDAETTASENEDPRAGANPFSTAPEQTTQDKASSATAHHYTRPDEGLVGEDNTMVGSIEDSGTYPGDDLNADLDNEVEEEQRTPRPQPQVRILAPRGQKRASADTSTPRPRATKKQRQELGDSQDSLNSSIKVQVENPPTTTSSHPLPARGQLSDPTEKATASTSQRSARSTDSASQEEYSGEPPRVVFSNASVSERDSPMKFLKQQGVKILQQMTEDGCDVLCVGNGAPLKSYKLLSSIVFQKPITTETWVTESIKAGHLLDPTGFPPMNAPREWEWGRKAQDVKEALAGDRRELFGTKTIFVTPVLKKEYGNGYKDLERLLRAAGAQKVLSKPARDYKHTDDTVILAVDHGDLDAVNLSDNHQCYNKDLVSMTIIRGRLDLDSDEFKIVPSRGRRRKS